VSVLIIVGCLAGFIGSLWLLVVMFQTSIWWGVGSFFLPFLGFIFVVMNWEVSKKPLLLVIFGLGCLMLGLRFSPEAVIASS
jgi:hypothetical protein